MMIARYRFSLVRSIAVLILLCGFCMAAAAQAPAVGAAPQGQPAREPVGTSL